MECIICNSESKYYFSKKYTKAPYSEWMEKIGEVAYHKCENCGFALSKTHVDLDKDSWNELNYLAHNYYERQEQKELNQPPYIDQALMMVVLGKAGIIDTSNMLDYAAGYGTLSKILSKYFNMHLPIYDKYVTDGPAERYITEDKLGKYKAVINSAMFEHILDRQSLDNVNDLVADDGCMIMHTLVCENVPQDANWFYMDTPVHTAFHTNKSMQSLMDQWGYVSSLYCPKSKFWVLLKKEPANIEEIIHGINQEFQTDYLHYKKGFVDYWKGF